MMMSKDWYDNTEFTLYMSRVYICGQEYISALVKHVYEISL